MLNAIPAMVNESEIVSCTCCGADAEQPRYGQAYCPDCDAADCLYADDGEDFCGHRDQLRWQLADLMEEAETCIDNADVAKAMARNAAIVLVDFDRRKMSRMAKVQYLRKAIATHVTSFGHDCRDPWTAAAGMARAWDRRAV